MSKFQEIKQRVDNAGTPCCIGNPLGKHLDDIGEFNKHAVDDMKLLLKGLELACTPSQRHSKAKKYDPDYWLEEARKQLENET